MSPTQAAHVLADLGEAAALILDAGPTAHGLEELHAPRAQSELRLRDQAGVRPLVARAGDTYSAARWRINMEEKQR